ncbi:restriction endonuclease subunit S [Arcobacter cryaerophilus gv. pseudocryaerophilus]
MSKIINIPKLRFKEFSGVWEDKLIGQILTVGSGKDYKHLSNGDIPVYGTGGYMLSVNDYLYDGESVGIGRKGTIDKPIFLTGKFWTVDTLFYTHSFKNSVPKFIYSIFQRINWKLYNEASGVPSLSKSTIEKIKIFIPSKHEQEKIASFLISIDTRIEQLTKKEELLQQYKKGVMQKIFNQEIRFKADDGSEFCEWEEKSLNELVEFSNGKAHENDIDESGDYIVVNSKFISSNGTVKKYSNSQIAPLYKNDIVMVMSDVPNGKALSKCYLIDENNKYTLNQRICSLRQTINNNKFLIYLINRNKYYLAFDSGVGQTNLRKDEVLNLKLKVPCLEEQNKIANFLSSIDSKIEQVQKQINSTKEFKKALLQQMFI